LNRELWQQWQNYVKSMSFGALAGEPPSAGESSTFAPFTKVAERFAGAARAYLKAANHAAAPMESAQYFVDALREMFMDTPMPWTSAPGAGSPFAGPTSTAAEPPALGALREHQQRWQRMANAWKQMDDAQRRLQLLWSDALRDAAAAYTAHLGSAPMTGIDPEAVNRLYASWIDCAEDAYSRMAHGEPFCDTLADFVNADSRWRQDLKASVEHAAKQLDLPTRSEINTLTRRLKMLEERLRDAQSAAKPKAAARSRPTRSKGSSR
jgi:class III poly(R)-hydroxyalkanoic acid synthase PhaE subunit